MVWDEVADLPFAAALRIHRGDLAPAEVYEGAHFDQLDLCQPDAPGSRFLECAFTRVSIQEGQLRRAQFTDVWLRDVRLISTTLAESGWTGAEITGSVAAGVEAFAARLRRVSLRGCKLDSVNFRSGTLREVTFEDCVLRDAEFGGATLRRVGFGGCTLARADFTKASCDEVDLRGAELGISGGYESLRGATIDSVQLVALAPLLARHLGIMVTD